MLISNEIERIPSEMDWNPMAGNVPSFQFHLILLWNGILLWNEIQWVLNCERPTALLPFDLGTSFFLKFMNDSQKKFKWNKKFQKKETQIYRRRYIEFQFE